MIDRLPASPRILAIVLAMVHGSFASGQAPTRTTATNPTAQKPAGAPQAPAAERPIGAKPAATSKAWTPPRTPDGQPDLQGVWLNSSATPLERPKALEGKAVLSNEEVAELKRRADRLFKDGNADLPVGDNLFLAALANPEQYRNPNGANRSSAFMVEREFDNRTSLVVDPPDGRIPPLTPEAQQKRAAAAARDRNPAGPEDINNNTRCITPGMPRIGPGAGGDPQYGYYQILQTPGYVVLLMETFHDTRIIPLDGRPHLAANVRQWSGDPRGRWEGNTLIVETSNFSPQSNFLGSGGNLRLVERLTRVSPDTITYEITVADPTTWTKPWTAVVRLKQLQARIYEFACHEGNNHSMLSILANTREAEKRAGGR
jgi:hypothetical protein